MVRTAAVLAALTVFSTIAIPASAVTNGAIAFVQLPQHGDWVVGTIDPDGSHVRPRTGGTSPAWSPDGSQLAYITTGGPLQEHVAIRAGGSPIDTGVPAEGFDIFTGSGMDWSPDGTRIAYTYQEQIWVMNATPPYDPVRLVPSDCFGATPTWSPDSSMVAYQGWNCMDSGLYLINADGTGNQLLPNPPGIAEVGSPDWSPDGTRFAFLGGSQLGTGLWVMDSDGTNAQFLVATVEFCCGNPSWSPDGSQIAFIGNGGLSTVNPDGSGLEVLRSGVSQPKWRAGG